MKVSIVTKQIREGYGYLIRIVAVGLREEGRLTCPVLDFLKTQRVEHPDLMDQLKQNNLLRHEREHE